ncbi:MAG: Stp1/IreP family PP2C-type Ser/Thr phosphatase [Betaproteobacteria bacterium]
MLSESIEIAGVTDTGSVRQFNEDCIAFDADGGIVVLADGMGGHRAGEIASRMATEIIIDSLRHCVADSRASSSQQTPQLDVRQSINRANDSVYAAAGANPAYHGMGTTLALMVFYDNRVTMAHVGDSRIYRLRKNRLKLLTRDDSLLREQVELGMIDAADARASHNRNLVTRALGIEPHVSPHVRELEVAPDDVFMVCSDGLNDLVQDADIELIIASLQSNLPLATQHLVQFAKDNGGFDNISVILVKVSAAFPATSRRTWFERLFGWLR